MNQNTSEVEYMTNEQYETQLLITVRTLRIIAKETKSIETILEALDTIEETIKKPGAGREHRPSRAPPL